MMQLLQWWLMWARGGYGGCDGGYGGGWCGGICGWSDDDAVAAEAGGANTAAVDAGGWLMQWFWWELRQCLRLGLMRDADTVSGG